MKKNYDFSQGKRGPVLPAGKGKTRITIRLDDDLLTWFRKHADRAGAGGYQGAINAALREHISREPWERALRRSHCTSARATWARGLVGSAPATVRRSC